MQAQDIERSLATLGQELQNLGVHKSIRLLLIGGAFMLTEIGNRPATNDVDVLLKDVELSTTSPLSQTWKRCGSGSCSQAKAAKHLAQ